MTKVREQFVQESPKLCGFIWPVDINFIYLEKKYIMSKVKISTQKGDMIVELYDNDTPKTVANFLKLINEKFYDGLN